MDFLTKVIFHFKKVTVIIVSGKGKSETSETVFWVLQPHFSVKKFIEKMPTVFDILTNKILLIETDLKNQKLLEKSISLVKFSQLPILVVSHAGSIPEETISFAGEEGQISEIKRLAQSIPAYGFLILNFDDKTVRKIDDVTSLKSLTFGLQEGADFRASDIRTNHGINFKINYKGKIIPIWQEKTFKKENIYSALAASCAGVAIGLNFVEISEALKNQTLHL